ncbi:hypothetical protein R1flu_015493 [Riccia fluitans]|uniref:Uncharacterized protein n=1 Tax=Riccia fluitans TaxID=41844 RepID=A0ABD1YM86_9MARC
MDTSSSACRTSSNADDHPDDPSSCVEASGTIVAFCGISRESALASGIGADHPPLLSPNEELETSHLAVTRLPNDSAGGLLGPTLLENSHSLMVGGSYIFHQTNHPNNNYRGIPLHERLSQRFTQISGQNNRIKDSWRGSEDDAASPSVNLEICSHSFADPIAACTALVGILGLTQ